MWIEGFLDQIRTESICNCAIASYALRDARLEFLVRADALHVCGIAGADGDLLEDA